MTQVGLRRDTKGQIQIMTDDQNNIAVFCGTILGKCNEFRQSFSSPEGRIQYLAVQAAVGHVTATVGEILAEVFGATQEVAEQAAPDSRQ